MSGSTLLTAPALEPVTIEEVRSQCRETDTSNDGLFAGYLLAARQLAETRTGRSLVAQTWVETFDEDWPRLAQHHEHHERWVHRARRVIMLPRPPLQNVVSITYVDTDGATQTLDPTQYRVGTRQLIGVIEQAYQVCWPAVRRQIDTISVQYVAGYASPGEIPEGIRQAILLLVAHFYRNREATVISASKMSVSELPLGVDALLAPHWVPWVF